MTVRTVDADGGLALCEDEAGVRSSVETSLVEPVEIGDTLLARRRPRRRSRSRASRARPSTTRPTTTSAARAAGRTGRTRRHHGRGLLARGPRRAGAEKRLKGLEPSTFCMASRRSSQLSYSRAWRRV
jgi:hypothetical protein